MGSNEQACSPQKDKNLHFFNYAVPTTVIWQTFPGGKCDLNLLKPKKVRTYLFLRNNKLGVQN